MTPDFLVVVRSDRNTAPAGTRETPCKEVIRYMRDGEVVSADAMFRRYRMVRSEAGLAPSAGPYVLLGRREPDVRLHCDQSFPNSYSDL